ncbi:MAG: tripartite tricarboxylate transporter substrate binding protein [Alphaproteobacteria bacterium]|nr:tripartite tricarboxylate transporter substrate binding protein [Alphaproteobacteria bacterium]
MRVARRTLLVGGLAAPAAIAQTWQPSKPLTYIIPGAAGSVLDVAARLMAQKMGVMLGQNVVVDNRPGAGGIVGGEATLRAGVDGHTFYNGNIATFAIAPFILRHNRWDARRDFLAVHGVGAAPNLIVGGLHTPWTRIRELVPYARANPGRVTFAATAGGAQHLAAGLFMRATGVEMTHVPYQNTVQALTDIAGGRVDIMFDYALSALPFVRDGRLRGLGFNAPQRVAVARDLPTLQDEGVQGANLLGWSGLYVPTGTPAPAVARLAEVTRAALRDPDVIRLFDSTGTILLDAIDGPALASMLEEELLRMEPLIAALGLGAR